MADKRVTLLLEARDRASKHVKGLRKSLGGLKSAITSVAKVSATFGAAAVGAAVLGLGEMTRRQLGAIDANAKFADEVGISTEALMGYRHAAELTGTKQETLDKGLQRMVRRLGEAAKGYGEGVKGLQALGLNAEQIAKKSPEKALLNIADAIKGQKTPAEQAAAAYALFGRQGQEMLTFLKMGSKGLQDTAAEADALGLTFNRIDAAKVEMANDAITRLKAVVTGVAQRLAIAVAPGIQDISELIQKLPIKAIGETIARSAKLGIEAIRSIAIGIGQLIQKIPGVSDVLNNLEFHVKNLPEHFNVWFQKGMVVAGQIKDLLAGVGNFIGSNAAIIAGRVVKNWSTMFHNLQRLGKNLVSNYQPIMANLKEVFSRVIKAIPDLNFAAFEDVLTITGHAIKGIGVKLKEMPALLRVAFTDMGKIAAAGWKAIQSGSTAPFANLDLGMGDALAKLDQKMLDHWSELPIGDSKLKKRMEQLAIELGEPLKKIGTNLTEGMKAIDTSSIIDHMRPFEWVEGEFTKQAKEAHALAKAELDRNRALFGQHVNNAKRESQKAIKDLQQQQVDLEKAISGGASSGSGSAGNAFTELSDRFRGLLEQFKLGREIQMPAVAGAMPATGGLRGRELLEHKRQAGRDLMNRTRQQGRDALTSRIAAGRRMLRTPLPERTSKPVGQMNTAARRREADRSADGRIGPTPVNDFNAYDAWGKTFAGTRKKIGGFVQKHMPDIGLRVQRANGMPEGSPVSGPSPQMMTIARETQAGLVPMQETAANTRATNTKLDQLIELMKKNGKSNGPRRRRPEGVVLDF